MGKIVRKRKKTVALGYWQADVICLLRTYFLLAKFCIGER